jgi:23S rRNA (cytidine1920-2'-O)/16S rRNA (cytidine1409-2'-O)-methyltransferase
VHEGGLAPTREQARALIMAGRVLVAGRVIDKPGTAVGVGAAITLLAPPHPYVGRGGQKLAGALDRFPVAVEAAIALDLGSSTGGFTDCLLQRGALRVYAIDVGKGLLDSRLVADPRVVLRDGCNARYLTRDRVPEPIDLAVADLAFISLRLILPVLPALLAPRGSILALVKPQFELGRGEVGRGVVREPEKHARAILAVAEAARSIGLAIRGVAPSPLKGARGNREFFLWIVPRDPDRVALDLTGESLAAAVAAAVAPEP